MVDCRVRIYECEKSHATVIGFGFRCARMAANSVLRLFLEDKGYVCRELTADEAPIGTISINHLEVQPPLSTEHVQAFGDLVVSIAQRNNESALVLDNRSLAADGAYSSGMLVARG